MEEDVLKCSSDWFCIQIPTNLCQWHLDDQQGVMKKCHQVSQLVWRLAMAFWVLFLQAVWTCTFSRPVSERWCRQHGMLECSQCCWFRATNHYAKGVIYYPWVDCITILPSRWSHYIKQQQQKTLKMFCSCMFVSKGWENRKRPAFVWCCATANQLLHSEQTGQSSCSVHFSVLNTSLPGQTRFPFFRSFAAIMLKQKADQKGPMASSRKTQKLVPQTVREKYTDKYPCIK